MFWWKHGTWHTNTIYAMENTLKITGNLNMAVVRGEILCYDKMITDRFINMWNWVILPYNNLKIFHCWLYFLRNWILGRSPRQTWYIFAWRSKLVASGDRVLLKSRWLTILEGIKKKLIYVATVFEFHFVGTLLPNLSCMWT